MRNKQSDEGTQKLFGGIGDILERGANATVNTLTLPQQLMKSATDFVSSPMSSIMIPIVGLAGLYIASQVLIKR